MTNGTSRNNALLEKIRQANGGRSLFASAICFCGAMAMLGFANMLCRFGLNIDLTYLLPWMIGGTVLWLFVPPLILWLWTGTPSGKR
ncbi:hypothetical protein [Acetobacter fallax]|uniref:DUF2798 domain-containing protein n=1 Tax=Acetobacter fallax TaxID=1737473 RepID=A0ABX0KE51_9PROT|nr:hypothetical protein [Acetobacter fallax]NHO33393.1 hypothetical protein [Acetobacter fallax]NHO37012.1 hypothetical protein [Acetobacter fallax]